MAQNIPLQRLNNRQQQAGKLSRAAVPSLFKNCAVHAPSYEKLFYKIGYFLSF
jgi:hypothetical protein